MIAEGFEILIIGMGVVFCFLILMVYVMQLTAVVITKYFPEKEEPVVQAISSGSDKARIAAAIAIARSQRRN